MKFLSNNMKSVVSYYYNRFHYFDRNFIILKNFYIIYKDFKTTKNWNHSANSFFSLLIANGKFLARFAGV